MRKYLCYLALTMLIFGCFLLYVFHHHQKTDAQPPKIAFSDQTLALSVHDPKSMLLQGVTATDNVDGDVTASLVVASIQLLDKSGNIQVTYAAFDAAGNAAKAVRQVQYTDYQSPRFCVQQSLTFAYNSSFNLLRLIKAQDILDGDISHRIRTISLDDSSLSTLGTHYVELKVSNTLGETAKLVIPVEVYESATRSLAETSVKELCSDSFKVYPNPVQNELHIEIPSSALPDAVAILYDFSGQLLRRVRITETRMSIDMTDYASGIYLLNIWTLSGEITYKIVKR